MLNPPTSGVGIAEIVGAATPVCTPADPCARSALRCDRHRLPAADRDAPGGGRRSAVFPPTSCQVVRRSPGLADDGRAEANYGSGSGRRQLTYTPRNQPGDETGTRKSCGAWGIRTPDLLHAMPDGLVRGHRGGSDWCRSARYWLLRASRSVCRCLKPLSLGLSLDPGPPPEFRCRQAGTSARRLT
jgi:hypothetical protein